MITNISLFTLWVTDQDAAKKFFVDTLGFVERADLLNRPLRTRTVGGVGAGG